MGARSPAPQSLRPQVPFPTYGMIALRTRGDLSGSDEKADVSVPSSVQHGTARGGFEVSVDRIERIVHMKLRGVWDLPTATEFLSNVRRIGRELRGRPWAILADSSQFPAQSPEVTQIRQEAMVFAQSQRCEKIASVASNAVHAMQFRRIAVGSHVGSGVFSDEKSALDWLRHGRYLGGNSEPASAAQSIDGKSEPASATQPIDHRRKRLPSR
jgi:hypothetical protein